MITKQKNINQIVDKNGYDLYFENLQLEEEIIKSFSDMASYPMLSRFSVSASSIEPVNHYLDSVVATSEFFRKISDQELKDTTFVDIIKSLDVSESLRYMFGEGLEKDVSRIEDDYNEILSLMEKSFPIINFAKRYPFTDQMRKFCHIFLSHALKPLASNMTEHQKQLKKTFELFNKHMKDKKDLQSTYFLSKLAGSLLGGIAGSIAVSALFSSMTSKGERLFSDELATSHQTWYRIQTTNLIDTCTSNYKPRFHHLFLTIVGGLILNINKDLQGLGFEITEFGFTGNKVRVDLHEEGENQFTEKIDQMLRTGTDPNEVLETIRTFAAFPQLNTLTDVENHLYIEKLTVHYLYLQAKSLIEHGEPHKVIDEVFSTVSWTGERINSGFSFLEEKNYKGIYETLVKGFSTYPDVFHNIYLSIIEKSKLYTWGDKEKTKKLLFKDPLSFNYITTCFTVKGSIPPYYIEDMQNFKNDTLIPYLNSLHIPIELAEKWSPAVQKENFFTKWLDKINGNNKLEDAIKSLDYTTTERFLIEGLTVKSITLSKEMIHSDYRLFLELLSNYLEDVELNIGEELLLEIIKNEDEQALNILLELGLDPFTPLENTYLLARVISQGNFFMTDTIYLHCTETLPDYQASIKKLSDDQLSPFYFLFLTGKAYTDQYSELYECVPVEKREKELMMSVSSLTSQLLWGMFKAGYDPKFVSYAASNDNSYFKILCSSNHYYVFSQLLEWNPTILETKVQGKTMLREIYELGHTYLAWHFHGMSKSHDIGEVTYEDVENAATVELNENYLILLNKTVDGVDEILKEIQEEAQQYGQWVIIDLIKKVLRT
jgi:hypothetical protein